MNRILKRIITLFLVAVIAISCPLDVFAAVASNEYISEVKIAYGKTANDAKKWLTNNGYTPVDADLNEEADSIADSARAVCIGYKTTKNPDEAITDLKTMNMKGNYSFEAYELVLEEQAKEIEIFVSQLTASLDEYRENYQKGLYKAKAAHDLLDKISDDDTGKTMGELLLNKTVQELGDDEYDKLTEEEKSNHADMVKILMQGNSQATLAIEQYLCIASDTSEDSFVERLSDMGSYDDFETSYSSLHNIKDGASLEKALASDYDDTAIILAAKLETFKNALGVYTNSEMFEETDEDAIIKYFKDNGKDGDYIAFCNTRNLYLALSDTEYEDGNLYAFLTSEDYDFINEDRYMLYPLAASLSDGQAACLQYVSLSQLFDNGIMDNDAWKLNFDKIKAEIIDKAKTVSAYAGINRQVFEGGVALTNEAKNLRDSSTDNYMSNWLSDSASTTTILSLTGFAVSAIATIGCKVAASMIKNKMNTLVSENITKWVCVDSACKYKVAKIASDEVEEITKQFMDGTFSEDCSLFMKNEVCNTNTMTPLANSYKLLNRIGNVICVIMVIFSVISLISAWKDIQKYYHTEKTPIPVYMVDESTDADGKNTYTYYSAVTCNRKESGFSDEKSEILKDFGDLNGDIGKEWLALYSTKDTTAGKPIKAEFLCKKGNNSAGSNVPLTMFGEKNAVNIVDEKYTYNDEFNGIYLFYSVGNVYTSSVITPGNIAIIAGCAVAVAAIVTLVIIKKKKTKKS